LPVRGPGYIIDRGRELLHVAAVHGSELGRVPVSGSGHGVCAAFGEVQSVPVRERSRHQQFRWEEHGHSR